MDVSIGTCLSEERNTIYSTFWKGSNGHGAWVLMQLPFQRASRQRWHVEQEELGWYETLIQIHMWMIGSNLLYILERSNGEDGQALTQLPF